MEYLSYRFIQLNYNCREILFITFHVTNQFWIRIRINNKQRVFKHIIQECSS